MNALTHECVHSTFNIPSQMQIASVCEAQMLLSLRLQHLVPTDCQEKAVSHLRELNLREEKPHIHLTIRDVVKPWRSRAT